ncbi:MAG: NAD-dependent epimerase/dehydratase family protein [Candidatus Kapabacteria bacterium]|nr:NAD-dependent epimerase/dehydratase family protein [Candidatus Kapabacteria bacterium]
MTQQTIFITGIAGFIGFHLARRLASDGWNVVGLDNCNDYYDPTLKQARLDILGESVTFYRGDLEDKGLIDSIFSKHKPAIVCHLAAQAGVRYSIDNPDAYISSNIVGFMNILEVCRHHKPLHLVYASSSSVYGMSTRVPFATDDPVDTPASLYAATKRSNELMAFCYSHLYGIAATGLRFFTVYGPWGRPDMAYYSFAQSIMSGKPINIYNHGELSRDFTYIDDVVESVARLLPIPPTVTGASMGQAGVAHRVLNIGNGAPVNLLEFVEILESKLGRSAVKNLVDMQPGDVVQTWADCSDLFELTGFRPNTPLAKGLDEFAQWFRNASHG